MKDFNRFIFPIHRLSDILIVRLLNVSFRTSAAHRVMPEQCEVQVCLSKYTLFNDEPINAEKAKRIYFVVIYAF